MTIQTALITGASSGIGLELARLFARDGYNLALVARSENKLRELADELSHSHGIEVHIFASDLVQPTAPQVLVDSLQLSGLQIDVLVNNAGVGTHGLFHQNRAEAEFNMLELNVGAVVRLTRLLLPGMVERGHGRILNLGSTAAFQPGPIMAGYFASKAYILSFSQALANELQGSGVSVTCLCPGPTRTGFAAVAGITESLLFKLGAMPVEAVAAIGYKGMQKGEAIVVPGMKNWLLAQTNRIAPRRLATALSRFVVS